MCVCVCVVERRMKEVGSERKEKPQKKQMKNEKRKKNEKKMEKATANEWAGGSVGTD